MILILLTVFLTEDSLMLSNKVATLGYDFNLLVEDPMVDVQFNPSILGRLTTRTIYIRPDWSPDMLYLSDFGSIRAAILYPSFWHNIAWGFLGNLSYKEYNRTYEYGYFQYSSGDTITDLVKKPIAQLSSAFPFLKPGGFFGLSIAFQNPYSEHGQHHTYNSYDTSYAVIDTNIYSSRYTTINDELDKTSLWLVGIGQSVPVGHSEVNFSLSLGKNIETLSESDSSYDEYQSTHIEHQDTMRAWHFAKNTSGRYSYSKETYDTWSGKLGFAWTVNRPDGRLRVIMQIGIENGDYTRLNGRSNYYYYEYYDEYTWDDSSYVYADTGIVEDTLKNIIETGDVFREISETGIGYEKPIGGNINLLIGFRLKQFYSSLKRTAPDTIETTTLNFQAVTPIGSEFYLGKVICFRAGIAISYTNITRAVVNETKSSLTDRYLKVNKSFGLGIVFSNKFRFDLYNTDQLTSLNDWKLEIVYNF